MTNNIDAEIKGIFSNYIGHRIGSHSDDYGGESDKPCYCDFIPKLQALFKSKMLEIIGEDELILELTAKLGRKHHVKEFNRLLARDNFRAELRSKL